MVPLGEMRFELFDTSGLSGGRPGCRRRAV
jgi:hypothetical protein